MEGDGEGLVAIVQGLENSGVTLTVCNRSRQNHNPDRRPPVQRIQINALNATDVPAAEQRPHTVPAVAAAPARSTTPALQRATVETSTGSDFSRMATASQICDGRYASSYKLAHCMMSPTSPPEAVTEFPPQRKEPCRNQGNFEIGGQSSSQWSGHGIGHNISCHGTAPVRISTSRARHYGGTQTWGDKCSSHRYSKSSHRETEAFAHSLRKYPSMAPFRTASTDLIEKLIRYTQAKNFQEVSRSTKSMRSLRYQKSSETYNPATRASKHQQTYTRRQDERVVNTSNVQIGHRGRTRNFKLYSPMSNSRYLKENRYTRCSSSYDYLKAGNPPYGQSNRSEGSRSPSASGSPERSRIPEGSRSPSRIKSTDRSRNPDRSRSPVRSRSPTGSRITRAARPSRCDRPLRFERSMRDLSLSEMSKYIRSTIRQICNESPVVFQVCPKLKERYNEHKKICPNKKESSVSHVVELEEEEDPDDQASGSVLSRFIQSFTGRLVHSTEQAGCQCTGPNCYYTKATQCVNNHNAATNTAACHCKTANVSCCRGMPCICAVKSQHQAYYNKRIDEEISEWLKNVPVHSIEESESKNKRETMIKELRKTLKHMPDNENFEANMSKKIESFVNDLPMWNPGKDVNDEKLFKSQLADKLTGKIIALPRKPDRFRDIVKKWVANMDFEDDGEEVDKDGIIDNFVNSLKSLAANRPACDVKYTNLLRKEIIELLVEQALKFNGDMIMLKKIANNLATEIASIPRNGILSGKTTDMTSEFEENIVDWICEHGMCDELKKDPKLIEGLAKKLNKLKSQAIFDEDVYEEMKEEVQQFVDDVGLAFETIDELIEELMKQLSGTIQMKEKERLDQEELIEVVSDWLRSLPTSDLHPRKFEQIVKDLVKKIQENEEQDNENLANEIVNYLVDTDLSIDSADLGIYVEELMEVLNILPSDKYYKEQAKRVMVKDIYDIIEVSPISEDQKEEMRSKAHQIIEMNLRKSSFNLKRAPDNVKETLLEDMDNVVSEIDIPKENRLLMKSRLSTSVNNNFDKMFTRLSRNRSDLKQMIAKDVKNAVEELPIDTNKKKDLMQQVKGTLSKNMDKPLPSNVKNNIKEEIADLVERCPICDDNNVIKRLSKVLSAVASKHLNIWLPKCVCDTQSEVEKDISSVIDKSSTEKVAWETVPKDFNEAGKAFRHDLNKIRNKLLDDAANVIEKSPIPRDVKSHLKDKLKTVLARNLDSSLSDEEKHMLLDDVSNIVREDMSEENRRILTNKLAKKLDTHQRKEESERLMDEINRLSIDSGVKKEIKDMLLETLYNPLTNDVQQNIMKDVLDAIDVNMDIPKHDKENLKSNISHAISEELDKLIAQDKEVPEIKVTLENTLRNEIKNLPISKDKQEFLEKKLKGVLTKIFVRPVTDEVKKTIRERLEDILDDLIINKGKADAIKTQLLNVFNKYFDKLTQTSPSIESKEILEEETQTTGLKEYEKKTVDNILLDMERVVDEAPIPSDKKNELKKKLKNLAIKNFKKPSEDIAVGLKYDIYEILDELNLPKDKKNKLKSELVAAADRNMKDLLSANVKPIKVRKDLIPTEEVEESEVKQRIFQEIEKMIDESAVPEEKKIELERKLKKLAVENLRKPFSDDVQDAIKIGIIKIIDDLPISISEKNRLTNALTDMVDENLDNLQGVSRKLPIHVDNFKELEDKTLDNILREMEGTIEEAAIPGDKKTELKKKLKNIAIQNFEKLSEDISVGLKYNIDEIFDELNLPQYKKNKLKRELTAVVDRNMKDLLGKTRDTDTKYPDTKRRLIADGKSKKVEKGLMPIEENVESEVKNCIFQGIEKIIDESAVPEEKKVELKQKLKKLTIENLRKPFSDDVQDAIKNGIAEIIDDLPISQSGKNRLTNALTSMVDKNLDNLRDVSRKLPTHVDNFKELEDQTLDNILREMEGTIEEAAIPGDKKIELKKKLKNTAIQNFEKPSEDISVGLKYNIDEIFDELNLPKYKKNKLKRELTAVVDRNMKDLLLKTRDTDTKYPDTKRRLIADGKSKKVEKSLMPIEENVESEAKNFIFQGIEKIINEAAVPEEKKVELKQKLKNLTIENLRKPVSDDVQDAIKIGIAEIINDLPISQLGKNRLTNALTNMVDKNLFNLRGVSRKLPTHVDNFKELEDKTLDNILREMEGTIEEAAIPGDKKTELKKKLKNIAIQNFEKPLEDISVGLKYNIDEIFDELNLPKYKKNKLKRELTAVVDKNMKDLLGETRDTDTKYPDTKRRLIADGKSKKVEKSLMPIEENVESEAKNCIFQGIEKIINEAAVPEEKKVELKQKLKKLTIENLRKPVSDDVQDAIKNGIAEIIDDLPISQSRKNRLTEALTNMVDKNLDNLRGDSRKLPTHVDNFKELEDKILYNILREMEGIIEEAAIPGDKKIELKKKLKNTAIQNFEKPSEDISVGLKYDIDEIIDELNLPKYKKNKLKRELTAVVDRNMTDLLGKTRDTDTKYPDTKRRLIADGKSKKVEKSLMPIEENVESEAKKIIFQGIEKIINEAAVPEEKKVELKQKLKNLTIENLRKPVSDDVQDAIKIGIAEIIDDLPISQSGKNRLTNALTDMVDKNLDNLRGVSRKLPTHVDNFKELKDKTLDNILREMEGTIEEAAIPGDKKIELKKKLKNIAIQNFEKPSEDISVGLKYDIDEIIDELNLPKYKKNKLKRELTAAVDRNMKDLLGETRDIDTKYPDTKRRHGMSKKVEKGVKPIEEVVESEVKKCTFQGIEKIINESVVPEEKKIELKRQLKKLAAENLRKPFSDDVQDAINSGVAGIIDDLPIPESEKNRLINALVDIVDVNLKKLRSVPRKLPTQVDNFKELEDKTLDNILREMEQTIEEAPSPKKKKTEAVKKERIYQGIEKIINESIVPEDKKLEIKRKLKRIATERLRKPFSDDVQDAIKKRVAEIIDDLPMQTSEKNKLKRALTNIVVENLPLKTLTQVKEEEPLLNIFEEMERAIEEAPISREKKIRLKNKLQDLATKDFDNKSLDDIAETLNDGMNKMIDELNSPRDKRNKLKSAITDMIHKNMEMLVGDPYELPIQLDHLKKEDLLKDETQRNNLQEYEKIIDEAPIPKEKKIELKKKLKGTSAKKPLSVDVIEALKDDINDIIDEQNLPEDIKTKQKRAFTALVDENFKNETNLTKTPHFSAEKRTEIPRPKHVIDESNIKESMKDEIKKSILHSKIASSEKGKLNFELQKMISGILAGFEDTEDERLKDILSKYGINPNYQKTLAEEFDKLLEIALQGGNYEDARKKLIAKFMRDLNLSEKEANALADELIDKAREFARQEGVPEILKIRAEVLKNLDEREDSDVGEAFEPSAEEYKAKLIETIKSWMDSLPIDLDPEVAAAVAEYLASDILDRQKYLQAHPEAITSENYEIENLKYQVFRRMNNVVDPKDLPMIMERTEGLYMMIMEIEPPAGVQKLHPTSSREQSTSQRLTRDQVQDRKTSIIAALSTGNQRLTRDQVQDRKTSIIAALSTGNVNYSLEDSIATNKNVRKQWSKNIDDVIAKLPLLRKEQTDKLAIYDETGQIDLLSTLRRAKEEIDTVESSKSTKLTLKNNIGKLTSRLSKVKEAYALSKTSRKKPRSILNSKQDTSDGKDNSNKSFGKMQRKLGPADILGIRSKATNTTKPDGTPHTAESEAESGLEDNSETEFNPGQASTPRKATSKQQEATEADYLDRVTESVTVWLDSMPIDLEPDVMTDIIKDLVTDIVDRQKYLQAHPDKKFSDDEEIESLRFQVFKRLDKVMEPDSSVTPSFAKMEELYKMINGDARGRNTLTAKQAQEFQTALNEEISAILNEYRICCDKRELLPKLANELTKLRKTGADQDDIVENLITTIKPLTYLTDDNSEELAYKLLYRTKKLIATIRGDVVKKRDFREAMMKDIGDVFEGRPMSQAKRRMMESQLAEGYADDLGIPLQESNVTMSDTGPESKKEDRYGMSFNGLSNFIDTWLSSIHTDEDDEKDENEIMDMKKERMYYLIHKIGEMNVDPEIFNDDSLYEAVLRDELQNLFGDVKINDDEFQVLTEDLVEKVLETQHRAHDEIAGQTYKKNLRDTISTLLPDQRNLSKEDQATIEILKDQLADAYIDLHYSGNNENQRLGLKRKISNAINTFCRDYLNRNPCSSLDSKNLNQDLYAVLNKVPLPIGDSIKYEVEQARIREEINDWVKDLPLQPQSPTELLARNKLIYVLSKKLFDMELEGQREEENNDLMRTEIVKFLNKLPLESEEDNDTIADTLIDKLGASEASRKYNSTSNVTIDNFGNVSVASKKSSMESPVCPGYKWLLDKRKPCPRKVCGQQGPRRYEFPPCTLSPEDHAHLERIRRRTCLSPSCVTSLMRKNKCHLYAGSPPVDAGSQTVVRPFGIQETQQSPICPSAFENTPRPCPRVSANLPCQPCAQGGAQSIEMEKPQQSSICPAAHENTPKTCPGASRSSPQSSQQMRRRTISSSNMSDSNGEVQPNKYCWDPSEKNRMEESELQQSGRSSRRQSESPPCHSPGSGPCYPPGPGPCRQGPCHPPWQEPCDTPRPASRRPAPSNSPGAAPCRPAPCQQPRPAPCHTSRPAFCRPAPCHSPRLAPCNPRRPQPCFPPGPLPCSQNRTCFSQPSPAPCRRPSLGRISPRPKSPSQNSSERYPYCDPHSSMFLRPSHRDILGSRSPHSRSPCSPSPCMSPFGLNPQYTPPGSPCFSKRMNECRMPKRDGLQDQPSNSSGPSQKERVIELGSLDDASNARPKKRPNEQSDWPKFHEDDNFWTAPMRRVILDEGIDDSLVMERERREDRVSCRCKERLVPKCGKPGTSSKEDRQNLKRCSKCCGIHCPYPSFLYFRQ